MSTKIITATEMAAHYAPLIDLYITLKKEDRLASVIPTPQDGLHTGPTVSNTGFATHPAIKTSYDPASYQPARAQGTVPTRGFAAGHGVRRTQAGKASSSSTAKDSPSAGIIIGEFSKQVVKRIKQAARIARIESVRAYEEGVETCETLAAKHGITPRQFLVWVYDQRRGRYRIDNKPEVAAPKLPRVRSPDDGLLKGAGGQMTDLAVRRATRKLEERLIALQQRLDMPTFSYRKVEANV